MDRHIGETELHTALNDGDYDRAWELIQEVEFENEVDFEAFTPCSHPHFPSSTASPRFARHAPPKKYDWEKFCRVLVEKSNNVINALNAKQMPPLHLACQQGIVPLARALLEAKACREQITSQTKAAPAPTERKEK